MLPEECGPAGRRGGALLARLYLLEQYHHMADSGAVELQRDGEHYWIDPIDLADTNGMVMGDDHPRR